MNFELVRIINLFNQAQVSAINILERDFCCPRPTDSMDYIARCVPMIREVNYEANGYIIRPHGIGMEVNTGKEKIDFDFGESGEFNGFDVYRLANYIHLNKIQTKLDSQEKLKREFDRAVERSLIQKGKGNVYYLTP